MPTDTDTYEEGYADACDDFRAILEEMGMTVHVTADGITVHYPVLEFEPETVH